MAFSVVCACSDKKKSEKAPAQEKVPTPPAVVGLAAVPANASAVIGIDVKALANSPIVGRALERLFAREPGLQGALAKVLDDCHIDLTTDVVSATIALVPVSDTLTDSLLVAKGRLVEGKIVACLTKSLSEATGERLETTQFEGRALYHQVGGEAPGLWLSFGSSDTVVVTSGRATLEASLGSGPKFSDAKDGVARYMSRAKLDATLWAISSIEPSVGQGLIPAAGGKVEAPSAFVASADLGDGLALAAELQMHSEQDAKTLISQASAQIAAAAMVLQIDSMGRMVQKAELSEDGHWATLRWSLTKEELQDLMGANLSGVSPRIDGSSIDKEGANDETPAPKSETERETQDGN
ncbi:MAG: hypothetical protein GY811_14385 [Myxococcales bacterium]|nr:hypothetical protein [Myxococcales bacterium]